MEKQTREEIIKSMTEYGCLHSPGPASPWACEQCWGEKIDALLGTRDLEWRSTFAFVQWPPNVAGLPLVDQARIIISATLQVEKNKLKRQQLDTSRILAKMLQCNRELYDQILKTPGFAFWFNELCKRAERAPK